MIYVRVRRIDAHMRHRLTEWLLTGIMAAWGIVLLLPYRTFDLPSLAGLAQWASENTWGWAFATVAAARATLLIINGSWHRSPHGRMLCAILALFGWSSISFGLSTTGIVAPGILIYPFLFFADLYIVFIAAVDARVTDEAALRDGQG